MTEKEYKKLLDRIKLDLYNEFINPQTAHYGMKYIDDDEDKYSDTMSDREILQDELGRLCLLQNKYVENEEYRKAAVIQNKISKIQNKIDKL